MNPLEYEMLMKPMRIYEVIERGMNPGTDALAADLQKAKPQSLFAVRRMYQELVDLNPELKEARISPSQVRSYVAVISGASSAGSVRRTSAGRSETAAGTAISADDG